MNTLVRWVAIILSFGVVAYGQPAFVPWLGLVAAGGGYALFWWGQRAVRGIVGRCLLAFVWFSAVHMVQLSWMTSDLYHGLYIWAGWAILCMIMGLQFALLTFFVPKEGHYSLLRVLAVPAVWTVMEWLRLYILSGYTWNPAGLALTGAAIPRQFASVAGIFGLTFWVILANTLVLWAVDGRLHIRRWGVALLVVALPYLFGVAHISYHGSRLEAMDAEPFRVLLVQPAIRPHERAHIGFDSEPLHPLHQWMHLAALVQEWRNKTIDLTVFPEGTLPYSAEALIYDYNSAEEVLSAGFRGQVVWPPLVAPLAGKVKMGEHGELQVVNNAYFCQALSNTMRCDVVVGLDREVDGRPYNAALFFQPGQTRIVDHYGKRVLLPFAEYLPGAWTRVIADKYGISGSYEPGASAKVFDGVIPLGVTICYDETFSNLIRENKALGAEVLVNITNDGWYPDSRLPLQHFHHGRLRAIENGLPMVRASSTGVTVAIDSLGRTLAVLGDDPEGSMETVGVLYAEVPRYHYRTLYGFLGDGFPVGLSFLIAFLALGNFRKR